MITIIHPSRQRPEKSFETCVKWIERSGIVDREHLELIISLDWDDPMLSEYRVYEIGDDRHAYVGWIHNDNRSAVDAINAAAKIAKGDILIVVSDDTDCPDNWAVQIEHAVSGKKDWIAKCPDGIQDWIITMPLMDREYYNRFGYIYHPEYRHMFCDTELSCVADLTARRINIDIHFPHLHYSVGGLKKDEVSERADATWLQGEELFLARAARNFDLVNPPGKIKSQTYLNWIERKMKR